MNSITQAALFLISTLFKLYLMVLLLRGIFQWLGANYYNPMCQFIIKITQPVVDPLQRFLPRIYRIDLAIITVFLLLDIVKYFLITSLTLGVSWSFYTFFVLSIIDIIRQLLNLFFYAILFWVILSWINPTLRNPITELLFLMTAPILRFLRRIIPPIAGFDLSPLFALIGIKLLTIFIVLSLTSLLY